MDITTFHNASNGRNHHHDYSYTIVQNGNGSLNSKKKSKKWSFGNLFKKKRTKSSDTESSSGDIDDANDTNTKRKSFLSLKNGEKNECRKVVGKFDIIIPKDHKNYENEHKGGQNHESTTIEKYDASPGATKRRRADRTLISRAKSEPSEIEVFATYQNPIDCLPPGTLEDSNYPNYGDGIGNTGSGNTVTNLKGASKHQNAKARARAKRECLGDSSSSDDEIGCSSKASNSSSTLRISGGESGGGASAPTGTGEINSLNKKSRTARTHRYIRRHFNSGNNASSSPVMGNQYSISNSDSKLAMSDDRRDKDTTAAIHQTMISKTKSAASSPFNSPLARPKSFQTSSLPAKKHLSTLNDQYIMSNGIPKSHTNYIQPAVVSMESLAKVAPPQPPPRDPNRRVIHPMSSALIHRPSSYAFDSRCHPSEIASYIAGKGGNKTNNVTTDTSPQYCADNSPRCRNPIQLVVNQRNQNGNLSPVSKMNEITFDIDEVSSSREKYKPSVSRKSTSELGCNNVGARPLSVVSEKSDNELLQQMPNGPTARNGSRKSNTKNLEEALDELEEIYNSLRLSDEDLLDRADRRDLQSAIRLNSNFSRHSWSDLDGMCGDTRGVISSDCLDGIGPDIKSLLLTSQKSSRRSAVADSVADDMARRNMMKNRRPDPISNPNLVSQSGSFILMSPALSPPPLVQTLSPGIAPTITNNEPDVTLDDVVYRSIKQSNNLLKTVDPQPPFGIPLGPISPAPNSDYLHAVPSHKYKSNFNAMRTPDVVMDDLAFRNLRKDMNQPCEVLRSFAFPSAPPVSKKQRAVRSLSANAISFSNQSGMMSDSCDSDYDNSKLYDVIKYSNRMNDLLQQKSEDTKLRSEHKSGGSFNNLSEVVEDFRSKKRMLLESLRDCLTFDGKEVTTPPKTESKLNHPLLEKNNQQSDAAAAVFKRNVALHRPIQLDSFNIESIKHHDDDKSAPAPSQMVTANADDTNIDNYDYNEENWCRQSKLSSHLDTDTAMIENSSSGVSSTSDTPDLYRRTTNGTLESSKGSIDSGRVNESQPGRFLSELYLDEEDVPSKENDADCEQDDVDASTVMDKCNSTPIQRKSSKVEITLSTPQPSDDKKNRRSLQLK